MVGLTPLPVGSADAPVVAVGRRGGGELQAVAFWLCCAWVVSQIYMVPVWRIGPSWSVWPSITDLVVPMVGLVLPFMRPGWPGLPWDASLVQRTLLSLSAGCLASYVLFTLDLLNTRPEAAFNDKGPAVGLYQLYRLSQYLSVFWAAVRLDLDWRRRRWLRRAVAFTYWVSSGLLLADYFGLIDTSELGPQIPRDLSVAGPWAFYARGTVGEPVGAIGFHHVYPSVQLLMLAAMYLYLMPRGRLWHVGAVLGCLWTCGFVGGSRAGFVAICLFVLAVAVSRFRVLVTASVVALALLLLVSWRPGVFDAAFEKAVTRQETIGSSYEVDGFAGRVEIWNERVSLLNESVLTWVIGTGFGSAIETGSNGHMLYLHIALECGLVGLIGFAVLAWRVGRALWRRGPGGRILFWATIALLLSALTQETFYPVPALSHFCGLYLFCVGVALRRPGLEAS